MKELEDLEKKLVIVDKVLTGHSHKELTLDLVYTIMQEMDSAFIKAYHAGAKPEELDPLNQKYIKILYNYLKNPIPK